MTSTSQRPFSQAGEEPSLSELMEDPIMGIWLSAQGLEKEAVWDHVLMVQARLRDAIIDLGAAA